MDKFILEDYRNLRHQDIARSHEANSSPDDVVWAKKCLLIINLQGKPHNVFRPVFLITAFADYLSWDRNLRLPRYKHDSINVHAWYECRVAVCGHFVLTCG